MNLLLINLYPFDEGTNDFATGGPISSMKSLFHARGEIFETAKDQAQFLFQSCFISQLLLLLFQLLDPFPHPCDTRFELCFVDESLTVAVNQARESLS
ncbi:MAG TPA: hypothetical protein VIY29_28330 [Ktedonobacteraceae bacterium]